MRKNLGIAKEKEDSTMGVTENLDSISIEQITGKIYSFRGVKVMLDRDLSQLYAVETKTLKQAVRRNTQRFPDDFMFELSKDEEKSLRSQSVTLKRGQHSKYLPFAFTEQGVSMLSTVLKSDRAIQVNIQIMRTFTKLRHVLSETQDLKLVIEELRRTMKIESRQTKSNFKLVFSTLDKLREDKKPVRKIGF